MELRFDSEIATIQFLNLVELFVLDLIHQVLTVLEQDVQLLVMNIFSK